MEGLFRNIMVLETDLSPLLESLRKLRQRKNISCFNSRQCFARLHLRQQGWSTFCGPYREARHARGIGRVHFRRCGFVGSVLRSPLHGPASPNPIPQEPQSSRQEAQDKFKTTPEGATSPVFGLWECTQPQCRRFEVDQLQSH